MSATSSIQFENRLWKLQQGLCSICAKQLTRDERFRDDTGWSRDHVYPRNRYARLGNRGNLLLAHKDCNSRKGNREPTGCEILLLHAVNAQLGHSLVTELRQWRQREKGPTTIQLAWQRLIERQAAAA